MDLIDEEDISFLQIVQDGSHLPRLLDGGSAGDANVHPHLRRDDAGQCRLAESGRSVKEQMIQCLSALLRRLDIDIQALLDLLLSDIIVKPFWS